VSEPTAITAGDTITWTRTEALYPASAGWVLTYYLSLNAAAPKTIECAASGDDHAAAVAAATTAAWAHGTYLWTARVAKAGEVFTVGSGEVRVLPDPSSTADKRTHAAKCLASIEAALETSVGSATVEVELDGVRIKKDRSELLRIRDRYRAEVRRERGFSVFTCIPVRLR